MIVEFFDNYDALTKDWWTNESWTLIPQVGDYIAYDEQEYQISSIVFLSPLKVRIYLDRA